MAKKKKSGHYCIGCGTNRPNEKFTGKGRKQHLCKECKKQGYEDTVVWDEILVSEDWEYYSYNPYDDRVSISLSEELLDQLKKITSEKTVEAAVHTSIVLTLFLSKQISLEKAASLVNCEYNEFIELLELNKLPWDIGDTTGNIEYKKSLSDLLQFVDQLDDERDGL